MIKLLVRISGLKENGCEAHKLFQKAISTFNIVCKTNISCQIPGYFTNLKLLRKYNIILFIIVY